MRAEEELWDKFAMLQSTKKGVGCDASARVAAQNEVRAVSSACGKASAAVEENRAALVEKSERVKSLGEQVRTLFNLLQDIERQVDVIIIEESCVPCCTDRNEKTQRRPPLWDVRPLLGRHGSGQSPMRLLISSLLHVQDCAR